MLQIMSNLQETNHSSEQLESHRKKQFDLDETMTSLHIYNPKNNDKLLISKINELIRKQNFILNIMKSHDEFSNMIKQRLSTFKQEDDDAERKSNF